MTSQHPLEPKMLPISLLPPTAVIPIEYVCHIHSQCCTRCGSVHEHSEMFAHNEGRLWTVKYTAGRKLVDHLVPITGFMYNLPIRVLRMAPKQTPMCHECIDHTALAALPEPERYTKALVGTEGRDSDSASTSQSKPRATARRPSLTADQLLDMLDK